MNRFDFIRACTQHFGHSQWRADRGVIKERRPPLLHLTSIALAQLSMPLQVAPQASTCAENSYRRSAGLDLLHLVSALRLP